MALYIFLTTVDAERCVYFFSLALYVSGFVAPLYFVRSSRRGRVELQALHMPLHSTIFSQHTRRSLTCYSQIVLGTLPERVVK